MKVKSTYFGLLAILLIVSIFTHHTHGQQANVETKNLTLRNNTSKWLLAASHNSTLMYLTSVTSDGTVRWGEATEFHTDGRMKLTGQVAGLWVEAGSTDWFIGRTGTYGADLRFHNGGDKLIIKPNGNVGIGTNNPTARLTVAGNISAREVRVTANAGADFVFEDGYALRPLSEVEQFVQANKHLPEIAPAAQMVKEGVNTGAFQIQLLQKVEELTLYVIAQEKRIAALEAENKALRE